MCMYKHENVDHSPAFLRISIIYSVLLSIVKDPLWLYRTIIDTKEHIIHHIPRISIFKTMPKNNKMDTQLDRVTNALHNNQERNDNKPGGRIIRGCGRGGISRANIADTIAERILPSHVRRALQMRKITVSNLDCGLTNDDVAKLFGEIGPVKFAKVNHDKTPGYADVLFEKHADAAEAMKKYDGVMFSGRKLSVQWAKFGRKVKFTTSIVVGGKIKSGRKKSKRKSHRRNKEVQSSFDEALVSQLEDCMKSKLNIDEDQV